MMMEVQAMGVHCWIEGKVLGRAAGAQRLVVKCMPPLMCRPRCSWAHARMHAHTHASTPMYTHIHYMLVLQMLITH